MLRRRGAIGLFRHSESDFGGGVVARGFGRVYSKAQEQEQERGQKQERAVARS